MPPTNFLFINKDAQSKSLTRSTSDEQANINSYVQRGRRHRRVKPASSKSAKAPPEPIVEVVEQNDSPSSGISSSSSADTGLTDYSGDVPVTEKAKLLTLVQPTSDEAPQNVNTDLIIAHPHSKPRRNTDPDTPGPPEGDSGSFHANQTHYAAKIYSQRFQQYPTSQALPSTITTIDPFNGACITIDGQIFNLLQYYLLVYHPSVWHTGSTTSPQGHYMYQPAAGEVIRTALESEVDMYAMLACMSARMEVVDHISTDHETSTYMHKALVATRKRIEGIKPEQAKQSEEILMIIFHLFAAEGYRDNDSGAKIHLQGAKTIVDRMGGLSNMRDAQMRELLVIGDGYLAAKMLEPCVFPCEYDPGPIPATFQHGWKRPKPAELDSFAMGMNSLISDGLIPSELVSLIDETKECAWVLAHASKSAKPGCPMMRWLQMRNMAIRYRLLQVQFEDSFHEALRASLIVWILTSMTLLGRRRTVSSMAPLFMDVLSKLPESNPRSTKFAELEIWMLMLGAMSSLQGSKTETWFIRRTSERIEKQTSALGQSARYRLTTDILTLQRFHEMFFYYDPIQRQRLERLSFTLTEMSSTSDMTSPWSTAFHTS